MKISVCMCTFNGEKYINEQLNSIISQTVKPHEIIVFDDCSQDNTLKIINSYKNNNKDITWIIHSNSSNIGWKENFKKALDKATGDVIFLCDQDDIWKETKIEDMVHLMNQNKHIDVLVCDYEIKTDDNPITNLKNDNNSKKYFQLRKKSFLLFTRYPGCSYCMRREILDDFNQIWKKEFPHDAIIWKIGYLRKSLYLLNNKEMYWRRHINAATNKRIKIFSSENVIEHYNTILLYKEYCNAMYRLDNISKRNKLILNKICKMLELRLKLYREKSFICFIQLVFYIGYYASFKSYLLDGLVLFKKIQFKK